MLRFRKLEKAANVDRFVPPFFDGTMYRSTQKITIPPHHAYTLDDLQRAGVRVVPVDTTLFHDDSALAALIDNSSESSNNEPSNNEPSNNEPSNNEPSNNE